MKVKRATVVSKPLKYYQRSIGPEERMFMTTRIHSPSYLACSVSISIFQNK